MPTMGFAQPVIDDGKDCAQRERKGTDSVQDKGPVGNIDIFGQDRIGSRCIAIEGAMMSLGTERESGSSWSRFVPQNPSCRVRGYPNYGASPIPSPVRS